jgi:hypothetical protein
MRAGASATIVCALGLALAAAAAPGAQRPEPLTEARVRALLKEAQNEAKDDPSEIVFGLDRRIRARWGDFESFPISIVRREDLQIILATPLMRFRGIITGRLRYQQELENIPWVEAAVVTVEPARIDAPDITSIRMARDGKEVPPLKNLLRPMTFTNGMGQKAAINAGEIHWPMSAFAPGAESVTITATPASGEPFVLTLQEGELQRLR